MTASARNVLPGKVCALRPGGIYAEVEIELDGGDHLVAVVERACADALGLVAGREVVAMIKAPWVMVATGEVTRLSARNRLAGTVRSVLRGAVNAEVVIALRGGGEVTATITREAAAELGLAPGVAASAVIKGSDVILIAPA